MKKVLLTGSTGFVGRHIAAELLKRGYKVFAISNSSSLPEEENLVQIKLNLFDENAVENFFKENKFDDLVHVAWYLGPKFFTSAQNIDWLSASIKLLKSFKESGGKKVLVAGTLSEYDFSYGLLKEDLTPLNNSTLYGKCKAAFFEVASTYAKQEGLDLKWARIFNIYGPHERQTRLMPSVICSILKNEDVKLSTCTKIQDYLHIFDVATAVVDLFESDIEGPVNVSSGTPVKLRDIVEKIAQILDYKGKLLYGAIPVTFEEPFVLGCNEKLKSIGWEQKISLEQGLEQTIDWWKNNL